MSSAVAIDATGAASAPRRAATSVLASAVVGIVLGAIGVAWAQTLFSERFPSEWTYAQGLLFIIVVGFFPAGLAGLGVLLKRRRRARSEPAPEKAADPDPDSEKVGTAS